jgi:hypothetical protein
MMPHDKVRQKFINTLKNTHITDSKPLLSKRLKTTVHRLLLLVTALSEQRPRPTKGWPKPQNKLNYP